MHEQFGRAVFGARRAQLGRTAGGFGDQVADGGAVRWLEEIHQAAALEWSLHAEEFCEGTIVVGQLSIRHHERHADWRIAEQIADRQFRGPRIGRSRLGCARGSRYGQPRREPPCRLSVGQRTNRANDLETGCHLKRFFARYTLGGPARQTIKHGEDGSPASASSGGGAASPSFAPDMRR